jgi:hypothetical protein
VIFERASKLYKHPRRVLDHVEDTDRFESRRKEYRSRSKIKYGSVMFTLDHPVTNNSCRKQAVLMTAAILKRVYTAIRSSESYWQAVDVECNDETFNDVRSVGNAYITIQHGNCSSSLRAPLFSRSNQSSTGLLVHPELGSPELATASNKLHFHDAR